jgi:methionyl-tRNA formyltransferase
MRIFLFVDGWLGAQILKCLNDFKENIVGIAVHPNKFRNNFSEIIKNSKLSDNQIFTVGKNPENFFVDKLNDLCPDVILVVSWTFILKEHIYLIPKKGCINFHMSFLPFNRGKKPNVWPIVEGTPAGVSIHYIDDGIDSGAILFRQEVEVEIIDTAKTLYKKQLHAFVSLFEKSWPKIKNNTVLYIENIREDGSFHLDKEFKKLEKIDLDKKVFPMELINHLRAKTFAPYDGAYFIHNGQKVYINIQLSYEEK